MGSVAEDGSAVQICATLVTNPVFAVLGSAVTIRLSTSDDTGEHFGLVWSQALLYYI
jgi:hypothetical protein